MGPMDTQEFQRFVLGKLDRVEDKIDNQSVKIDAQQMQLGEIKIDVASIDTKLNAHMENEEKIRSALEAKINAKMDGHISTQRQIESGSRARIGWIIAVIAVCVSALGMVASVLIALLRG